MTLLKTTLTCALSCIAAAAAAGPVITTSYNATALASAIGGAGISISNAVFSTDSNVGPAGTFSGGASTVGFDSGIVLTTGITACATGANNQSACTGDGRYSSLKFDFKSDTGRLFFSYVFASEEYNYFVGSAFNDKFELLLNGMNIALLPDGSTPVTVNNVNCDLNAAYFRNNTSEEGTTASCANLGLDIQYDGLTTVLTASADVIAGQTYSFEFKVSDVGDTALDSGVFIKAGSFSGNNQVPEPDSLALVGLALAGLSRRRA